MKLITEYRDSHSLKRINNVPIIFLTALSDEEDYLGSFDRESIYGKEGSFFDAERIFVIAMPNAKQNMVMSREWLLVKCRDYDYAGEFQAVDTHIKRLREKFGDYADCIKTVIKTGYRVEEIMKKKIVKSAIVITALIVVTMGILSSSFVLDFLYPVYWKKTTITKIKNDNTGHSVTFQEVGEAFGFGSSTVRIILEDKKGRNIAQITDHIYNDGKRLNEENISVNWGDMGVVIILCGEEQPDKYHIMEY